MVEIEKVRFASLLIEIHSLFVFIGIFRFHDRTEYSPIVGKLLSFEKGLLIRSILGYMKVLYRTYIGIECNGKKTRALLVVPAGRRLRQMTLPS